MSGEVCAVCGVTIYEAFGRWWHNATHEDTVRASAKINAAPVHVARPKEET